VRSFVSHWNTRARVKRLSHVRDFGPAVNPNLTRLREIARNERKLYKSLLFRWDRKPRFSVFTVTRTHRVAVEFFGFIFDFIPRNPSKQYNKFPFFPRTPNKIDGKSDGALFWWIFRGKYSAIFQNPYRVAG